MQIQKVEQDIIQLGKVRSFSVIGDPGCEGLGTLMMQVYANALAMASRDDFILVAGDFVPEGSERFYKAITGLTNAVARKPVYALRGNHDTGEYDAAFGQHNYALISDDFTLVVLDNAFRKFEEAGLDLLRRVLQREDCQNVVIAFHIPIPNHFTGNAVAESEFQRLQAAYRPYADKVKYFICGHVHSRFVDEVDKIPFICTGGGGAMIEDVSDDIHAADVNHHIIRFTCDGSSLKYEIADLVCSSYTRENGDSIASKKLEEAIQGEMMAHLMYLNFSERAQRRGYSKVANLFRALAESEYRHARSFYAILDQMKPFASMMDTFIPLEKFEYERLYRMMRDYAKDKDMPLARQAYASASAAEVVHAALLEKAQDLKTFAEERFYVCPVCGYLMTEENKEARCPVCGAPAKQYICFVPEGAE